jgi:hypothetical protein
MIVLTFLNESFAAIREMSAELAVVYAALILQDDNVEITVRTFW